jgi:hypothetical protein
MAFISVTRLKPRGVLSLPSIALHTLLSRRQIERATGFLGGYLATGPGPALWTVTAWTSEAAMAAYRGSGAHAKAMPRLSRSCSEASITNWLAIDDGLPTPDEAAERMRTGRTSRVRHPSPAHAAGDPWPDRIVPFRGPPLSPA